MRRLFLLLLTVLFVLAVPTGAFAAYTDANTTTPTTPMAQGYTAPLTDGDTADNYQGNANRTGGDINNVDIQDESTIANPDVNNIIKSKDMMMNDFTTGPRTQRTHGEYQNNTNSCASCHQTHTGAAKDLLFKGSSSANGVYNTCTACHDGTLGFYNVFSPSTAGTFAGTADGNASVHLATGMANIYMAPGADAQSTNNIWNDEFDCAACHAPHGSYSDRLLHYSPAGMANVSSADGGNKLAGMAVADTMPAADAASDDFVLYRTTAGTAGITGEAVDTPVVVVMKKVSTTSGGTTTYDYEMDTTPWVAGYEHAMNDSYNMLDILYYTQFMNAAAEQITTDIDVMYGLAYARGTAVADVATADIARAYVVDLGDTETINGTPVDMEQIPIGDFGGVTITQINTDIYDEQDHGKAISKYCGACHTMYMTHSQDGDGDGVFRHSTDTDRFNCLKCHFAHGSDASIMKDANDNTVASLVASSAVATEADATAYMVDKNPSSALKRYTNMSVCWKCHSGVEGKSSKLMNNTYYWNNYDTNPKGGAATTEHNWTNNTWE